MDNIEFKKLFSEKAKTSGFEYAFGGWFKESTDCIVVLDLQKSNFGNYYEMNIKVYIHGIFGKDYIKNKGLVKKDSGDVFKRQPVKYKSVFDFDSPMNDDKRIETLNELFNKFIVPYTDLMLSKSGIKLLSNNGEITLLPAVKSALEQQLNT